MCVCVCNHCRGDSSVGYTAMLRYTVIISYFTIVSLNTNKSSSSSCACACACACALLLYIVIISRRERVTLHLVGWK
jgi:hypothetical protein